MLLHEIVEIIEGELLTPEDDAENVEVHHAFASDLMSDVLAFASSDMLLITGLTNPQSVRTAEMADMPAILFVRGKQPPEMTVDLAERIGIAVLLSPYTMFETSGLLYEAGLQGIGKLPIQQT
jgi:predicted transcriptional regulator